MRWNTALSRVPVAWSGKMPTPASGIGLPDTSRSVERKLGAINRAADRREVVTRQSISILRRSDGTLA